MNSTITHFRNRVDNLIKLIRHASSDEDDDEDDDDDDDEHKEEGTEDMDNKESDDDEESDDDDDDDDKDKESDDDEESENDNEAKEKSESESESESESKSKSEEKEKKDVIDENKMKTDGEEEDDDTHTSTSEEDYSKINIKMHDDDDDYDIVENEDTRAIDWDDDAKNLYALSEQEPNSLQVFTRNPYYYLSDAQSRFSPDLTDSIKDSIPIEYFLYIYIVCNNTNFDPYLACLLKYDESSKSYTFPKIKYDPLHLKDEETHDVYIQNMCYEIIYQLFEIEETQVTSEFIENTKDCFKGSLFYEGMKSGYLCFNAEKFVRYLKGDSKNLSEYFHKKEVIPMHTWACVYEITVNKKVHNVAVHPDVIDAFQEYEWLREIKNGKNENTTIPMMLYSCTIKNNKIDQNLTDAEKKKFLPPVSYHTVLERVRFFTNDSESKHPFQMPRYIVFLGDVKVIEDDITKKTDLVDKFKQEKLRITSVQFKLENKTIYGVFSSDCIYNF